MTKIANSTLELFARSIIGQCLPIEKGLENGAGAWEILMSAVANMPVCVYWKNLDSVYLGGNNMVRSVAGLSANQDIIGYDDQQLEKRLGWGKDVGSQLQQDDQTVFQSVSTQTFEGELIDAQGKPLIHLMNKVQIYDQHGDVIGVFGISTDITKRKHLQKTLSTAKEHVEFASQANGDFLKIMRNEFQESLNNIVFLSQQLQAQPLQVEQKACVNKVIANSHNMLNFINEMLGSKNLTEDPMQKLWRKNNNKFSLKINSKEIVLTKREMQCLAHLFLGRTARATGLILNISAKTVESYIDSVRLKLNCFNRPQLIDAVLKNNLVSMLQQFAA